MDWDGLSGCCGVYCFVDDFSYVRDDEICMYSIIGYIAGSICYGSKNFVLGSLHDDCAGLAGASPQSCSVAPFRFDYRIVDE
jgi:hypothetical protein